MCFLLLLLFFAIYDYRYMVVDLGGDIAWRVDVVSSQCGEYNANISWVSGFLFFRCPRALLFTKNIAVRHGDLNSRVRRSECLSAYVPYKELGMGAPVRRTSSAFFERGGVESMRTVEACLHSQ